MSAMTRAGFREEEGPLRAPLRDVLSRRGKGGLIAFFLLLAPLLSLAAFLPNVYLSSATVLIERQQIPDELVRSTVTSALEIRLQTISQEILSRSRLEELINRFGLYRDMKAQASMERVIEQMRKDVRIELRGERDNKKTDRATVAFTVSYSGREADKVALVANALASAYIEENLKLRERQAAGTADFLRTQLEDLSQKLQEQERLVGAFKEKHIGQLPEQMDANLKTLEQLTAQLRLNGDNVTRANERKASLERQMAEALAAAGPSGPDAAAARLAQLRDALGVAVNRYSDKHPEVMRLRNEIQAIEAQIGAGPGQAPTIPMTPAIQQLKTALLEVDVQLKGLEAEGEGLRRTVTAYQARVEGSPRTQQQYQILAREYETTKEMYRSLTVRQRESELAESMEQRQKGEQFRVIEPALPAQEPAAPKRPVLLLLALGIALAAGALAILGPEALDGSLHTIEQAQTATDLPVLVTIPRIVGPLEHTQSRRRLLMQGLGTAAAVCALVAGSYFLARENWALTALFLR